MAAKVCPLVHAESFVHTQFNFFLVPGAAIIVACLSIFSPVDCAWCSVSLSPCNGAAAPYSLSSPFTRLSQLWSENTRHLLTSIFYNVD